MAPARAAERGVEVTTPRSFLVKDKKIAPATIDTILSRSKMNYHTTVVLVVEGPDDKRVYSEIFGKSVNIEFLEGKSKVIECMKRIHGAGRTNVVGLVDSDYDKVLKDQRNLPPGNVRQYLFYTDTHDLNTMVVSSGAFFRLLSSTSQGRALGLRPIQEVRDDALNIAKEIGLFRCLSADQSHPMRFNFRESLHLQPPQIQQYIDLDKRKVRGRAIIDAVGQHLGDRDRENVCRFVLMEYLEELQNEYQKNDISWQLAQGHDLFCILYVLLDDVVGISMSFDDFSYSLLDIFGFDDFLESGRNLYNNIRQWEQRSEKMGRNLRILKNA